MIGRIISASHSNYRVEYDNKIYLCTIEGKKFKNKRDKHNFLCSGDRVEFDKDKNVIIQLLNRENILKRYNKRSKKIQYIASNFDKVYIVMSVKKPFLDIKMLDRLLAFLYLQDIEAAIIINKIDLQDDTLEVLNYYKNFYKVFLLSILKKINTDSLKEELKNKTSVLIGKSGVGKSSIINHYCNTDLKVNETSRKWVQGVHTTTLSKIINYKDIKLIDTPGFRDFILKDYYKNALKYAFYDFYGYECKLRNCLHINENDCGVKQALKENKILDTRYQSYLSLMKL